MNFLLECMRRILSCGLSWLSDVRGALLGVFVAGSALFASEPAFAHGTLEAGESPWLAWRLTPDITLSTLFVAYLYVAGIWSRRQKTDGPRIWRNVFFFAGLAAIFLALQSPIDAVSERIFLIHQIQHLLLRMIGPMLLMLAVPQALLIAGMPGPLRRCVLSPIVANRSVQNVFGVLAHPVVAAPLFIASLYFWQIPKYHNMAVLNDYVHYLMHTTMLFAGLLFFWRVFDFRPAPLGTRYGVRLLMLWITILANILIGSYLAFKQLVLYPAYDEFGRLGGFSALTDEQLGAATIWIPGSMMGGVAVLIVIHMWGRHETKEERRRGVMLLRQGRGRNEPPMTAADLIQGAAGKNRTMALGFGVFVIAVFATAIAIGLINQIIGASPTATS